MEPIRILNVVGRMDRGGIETLIMNVYRHIDRSKVQFDFLAHYGKENADYNEEIRRLGGRIYEMPVIKSTEKTYYGKFFEYRRALKRFFREHPEYHIVHGHMTNTAAIYMPIAKKYGKVTTCIAHSHLSRTQKAVSPVTAVLTDLLIRPVRKQATDYFSCSDGASRWLFGNNPQVLARVQPVQNGIDSALFAYSPAVRQEVRQELGLEGKTVIGHVGRFYHAKNHSFLIDVFAAYARQNPQAVLLLVGDGELKEQAEQKVARLGLTDRVIFAGLRSDVYRMMQGMDLFLMPSLYEGLPLVGVEAQTAGLPLVVSTGITEEMNITGHVRFLTLEQPIGEWVTAISESLDGFERVCCAEVIRQAGYDIQHTVDFLQDFYLRKHREGEQATTE